MKRKFSIMMMIALCAVTNLVAQEDVFFSNKQLRLNYMNPAYVPEIMYASFTLGGRYQWTGLDGAPKTYFASGKYFFMGAHSQVGLSFLSDEIGYQYTRNPKLSFAFMIPVADDSYINLGVGGGLVNRGYDASKIKEVNTLNTAESYEIPKGTAPDAEVGLELLLQNFELGFSANHLLNGTDDVPLHRLYSGYANYYFQTSEWWRLAPSYFVYNYQDRWKHQLSLYFYYVFDYQWNPSDLFYVGATYRFEYEGSIMVGVNPFEWLSIFYSYDYFFGNLRHGSYGSHEVGLEFRIPQKFQSCFANYGQSKKYTRYTRMR